VLVANIAAYGQAQTTRGRRAIVADDVADQIWANHHVVPFRITNLPLTERVDISVIKFQVRKFALADFTKYFAEKPVRADDV